MSSFSQLEKKPDDPIISVFADFLQNPNPNKQNLSIGIYFDEKGKVDLLDSVKLAYLQVAQEQAVKTYLPIEGHHSFTESVCKLVFGADNPVVTEKRIASVQTIAATGGLRVTADFLYTKVGCRRVFVTDPTWSNHIEIYKTAGFEVDSYYHFDFASMGIDFEKTYNSLASKLQEKDVVLFHPVCHNPSGADYTPEQWDKLIDLVKERNALAIFDMAYLGFGKGIEEDCYAVRRASQVLPQFVHIFSGSKSFSLYAERIGSINFVCKDAEQAKIVQSVLKNVIRASYSSPTSHGAKIINKVLNTPELTEIWKQEVNVIRERLADNRKQLSNRLLKHGIDFSYITSQYGFFSFLKVTPAQALRLRSEYAIYILESGRINFAGINPGNVDYIADSLASVIKG